MSRPFPTTRGAYHPYTARGYDWQPLFDILSDRGSAISIRALAEEHHIPYPTLRGRWQRYRKALSTRDERGLRAARGDVDGRADNHRVFSREEEAQLKAEVNKENAHPNKPFIQATALRIHQQSVDSTPPAKHTRRQSMATATFKASDSFVARVKQSIHMSDHKPKLIRKPRRRHAPDNTQQQESAAIQYIDAVTGAVTRNGADFVINADEVPYHLIRPPLTLWGEINGPPPVISSERDEKEMFTVILATTASGKKLKPALVARGRTDRVLAKFQHLGGQVHLMRAAKGRTTQTVWMEYIEAVIMPYCRGHAATLVADSHASHIMDECASWAMQWDIYSEQVPPRMTAQLQPDDVGVFGPLMASVGAGWLNDKRTDPSAQDGPVQALERLIGAWSGVSRHTVRSAWVKAVPTLRGMSTASGTVDEEGEI